jgi:hypothetical protein
MRFASAICSSSAPLVFPLRHRRHGRLQRHAPLVAFDVFPEVIERFARLGQQAFDLGGIGLERLAGDAGQLVQNRVRFVRIAGGPGDSDYRRESPRPTRRELTKSRCGDRFRLR